MQKNPGAKTIEGDFEEALFHSGAVLEQDRGYPRRYDWARSARTDKGVSAVGQVVSGKFYVDPPGFVDRLSSHLPDQVKIFGYKRVTASFNSKKFCDRRRYVYLIPVFALDPNSHQGRIRDNSDSGDEFVKCLECSERGLVVECVMVKPKFEAESQTFQSGISSNTKDAILNTEVQADFRVSTANCDDKDDAITTNSESMEEDKGIPASDTVFCSEIEAGKVNDGEESAKEDRFCYGEKEKERFNRILKHYTGTHNFHNFTTRTKAEDPSAIRYIISFHANTTVMVDGVEFVKCEVVGQSFMLHQIRKMMGLAVAVMRNLSPESLIETALQKNANITVPTAPETGLYLDECLFSSYNKKWKNTHEELSMKSYEEEAEEFKMKYIHSHIASTELKEGVIGLWLHYLNYRNYPDLRVPGNGETIEARPSPIEGNGADIEGENKGDVEGAEEANSDE